MSMYVAEFSPPLRFVLLLLFPSSLELYFRYNEVASTVFPNVFAQVPPNHL